MLFIWFNPTHLWLWVADTLPGSLAFEPGIVCSSVKEVSKSSIKVLERLLQHLGIRFFQTGCIFRISSVSAIAWPGYGIPDTCPGFGQAPSCRYIERVRTVLPGFVAVPGLGRYDT